MYYTISLLGWRRWLAVACSLTARVLSTWKTSEARLKIFGHDQEDFFFNKVNNLGFQVPPQ